MANRTKRQTASIAEESYFDIFRDIYKSSP